MQALKLRKLNSEHLRPDISMIQESAMVKINQSKGVLWYLIPKCLVFFNHFRNGYENKQTHWYPHDTVYKKEILWIYRLSNQHAIIWQYRAQIIPMNRADYAPALAHYRMFTYGVP